MKQLEKFKSDRQKQSMDKENKLPNSKPALSECTSNPIASSFQSNLKPPSTNHYSFMQKTN